MREASSSSQCHAMRRTGSGAEHCCAGSHPDECHVGRGVRRRPRKGDSAEEKGPPTRGATAVDVAPGGGAVAPSLPSLPPSLRKCVRGSETGHSAREEASRRNEAANKNAHACTARLWPIVGGAVIVLPSYPADSNSTSEMRYVSLWVEDLCSSFMVLQEKQTAGSHSSNDAERSACDAAVRLERIALLAIR